MRYFEVINYLKKETGEVILFHSGTGKDSIALLEMLHDKFEVKPVFMYLVPDLEYENRYIVWAEKKYKVEFIKTPHYALNSFIKHGYLGIKKDESITLSKISKIDTDIKRKTGINWSVYGFKKVDGITRRIMLNGYENGLSEKTKKAYPLMDYTNGDVLKFISDNTLIPPFSYGTLKPSSGCDISTPEFLAYLGKKYPDDLKKIFTQFPLAEVILFKYKSYGKIKTI